MPTLIAPVPSRTQGAAQARGVLFVHSCPRALSPHVQWAVTRVMDDDIELSWQPQPVLPGAVRAEYAWRGEPGTAARLATSLRGFTGLRFEVTEEPGAGREGERFSVTPALGVYRACIGPHGDVLIPEDRVRSAMTQSAQSGESLRDLLEDLLGARWDEELEPFRYAGDGDRVRFLHRVG